VKVSDRDLSLQVSILAPTANGPVGGGKLLKGRVVLAMLAQPEEIRAAKNKSKDRIFSIRWDMVKG
jgi:hypothetical protein